MKKKLSSDLTLFFHNRYPFKNSKISQKKNYIFIGIGGNVGNTQRVFNQLFNHLSSHKQFDILQTSPILRNPPFGFLEQNDFYNGMIILKTNISPNESLKLFQHMEKRFKRKRSFKDAPRTLDIDIIFFNLQKINSKKLIVPHPHYSKRQSVLIPLEFVLSA